MAVSFVGSATAATSDGSDPVIDLTEIVGLAENDVVYVGGSCITGGSTGNAGVSTSGFAPVATTTHGVAGGFVVERKVMGGTPDSSVTCQGSGSSGSSAAYVAMAFRGVDTATPEDVTPTVANDGFGSGDPNPPSIDPDTDDCGILIFGGVAGDTTLTAPSGYGDLEQVGVSGGSTSFTDGAAWKLLSGSAAEDPAAFDAAANGFWAAATIALRPAAGDTSREAEIDQTLPAITQKATNYAGEATAEQTLPSLTQDATAIMGALLSGASVLPGISQSATAVGPYEAEAASTLPSLRQSATADLVRLAAIASLLPMIRQQAAAAMDAILSGASPLPAMSQSATAIFGMSATAASRLGAIDQQATAIFEAILTGSSELGAITQAALAKSDFVAEATGTLRPINQHLIGWVPGDPTITDTTNLQKPVDFQYAGRPQGDRPLTLRGLSNDGAARKLGRMLKF